MYRFIDEDKEGFTNTATWLIIFREDYETINSAISSMGEVSVSQRHFNVLLTFRHETVHFWHAISTNFLFNYSLKYLQLCRKVLNAVMDKGKSYHDIPFSEFEPSFNDLISLLYSKTYQIRAIDVIEGCAVLCSYRLQAANPNHAEFLRYIRENHHNQDVYTNAYFYTNELIGENAFDFFSPACYLALQYNQPGESFESIILLLKDMIHYYKVSENPLQFLFRITNIDLNSCFPSAVKKRGISQDSSNHPILLPYIKELSQTSNIQLEDLFARPYYYEPPNSPGSSKEMDEFIKRIVPPMHLYSGRWTKLMGLGDELGIEYGRMIIYLTALNGLIPFLVFGEKEKMICPHTVCSLHKKGLCQKYYAFPIDDYKNCIFPEILKTVKLGKLLED